MLKFLEAGANVPQLFVFNQENQVNKQYIADSNITDLVQAYDLADDSEKAALTTLANLIIKNAKK